MAPSERDEARAHPDGADPAPADPEPACQAGEPPGRLRAAAEHLRRRLVGDRDRDRVRARAVPQAHDLRAEPAAYLGASNRRAVGVAVVQAGHEDLALEVSGGAAVRQLRREEGLEALGPPVEAIAGRRAGDDPGVGPHDCVEHVLVDVVRRRRLRRVLLDLTRGAEPGPHRPPDHELVREVGDALVDRRIEGVGELGQQKGRSGLGAVALGVLEDHPLAHVPAQVGRVGSVGKPRGRTKAVVVKAHADVRVGGLPVTGLRPRGRTGGSARRRRETRASP